MPSADEQPPLRIKAVSLQLSRVAASGTSNTNATPTVSIRNPSRRLSCAITIAFEPTSGSTPADYQSSTWSLRVMRPNRITRRTSQLHRLVTNQTLPNGYELDSAARELLVTTSLNIPLDGALAAIPGSWVLLVEWEPNQPAMCTEEEIANLFAMCEAGVSGEEVLAP